MRLFFALWPDAAAASRLARAACELALLSGGKPVPQEKIHLTLAFLGEVGEEGAEAARRAGEALEHAAFDVRLDQWGSFRAARVGWAGCRAPPPGLSNLRADLAGRLRRSGLALDERPYSPHATLVRKITRAIPCRDAEPVGWRVREVALVRSELGKGSYATLASWELG